MFQHLQYNECTSASVYTRMDCCTLSSQIMHARVSLAIVSAAFMISGYCRRNTLEYVFMLVFLFGLCVTGTSSPACSSTLRRGD